MGHQTNRIRGGNNSRKGKNAINITYKGHINKGNFVPRRSYERAEDWMITCSVCRGSGAIGKGDLRKRCPNCEGAGKVSSTPQTRKLLRDST